MGVTVGSGWVELAGALRVQAERSVYLLGPTDTGKTTLAWWLLGQLAGRRAALVSADPGQPAAGPPACAALTMREPGGEVWSEPLVRLVGDVSPSGHLLQLLASVGRLTAEAVARGAELVVVDTAGMVQGDAARVLHLQTIDLLDPDVVVALAPGDELAPILAPLEARERPRIARLRPSDAVSRRSPETRARYRAERFAAALAGASPRELSLPRHAVHGRVPADPAAARGRLAALLDGRGFVLSLAVVEAIDDRRVRLLARDFDARRVSSIELADLSPTPPPR